MRPQLPQTPGRRAALRRRGRLWCVGWKAQKGDRVRYRARYRDPSGKEVSKTFARAEDARQHLVSTEDSKLRGAYIAPEHGKVRFAGQAERWFKTTAALRPSTRRDYRQLLDNQVLPKFQTATLAGIDALAVREWVAEMVGGGLGAKRARKAHQVLSSAVDGGLLARNVAAGIKLPKVQKREMHFLSAVQVEALADAIAEPYGTLIRGAAYTGLRPCEQVALKVGRLDLLRGTVRVAEAVTEVAGSLERGPVKTHEARTVRVPRSIAEELGRYLRDRPHEPDDLVFTAPLGGTLRENNFMRRTFRPAVTAANESLRKLPKDQRPAPIPDDLRWYDLRHTCASLLIRQAASIKAVQKQLGHATASQTLDVYGHLFPDELDVLADKLETLRTEALAARVRTGNVPAVVPLREGAGR